MRRTRLRFLGAVAQIAQPEYRGHLVLHEALRLHGLHLPDGGAGREHFDEGESQTLDLVLHGALDHLGGVHDLLVVAQRHALDEDRRFERIQHLADVQRVAFVQRVAAERGRGGLLAERGGGRHLPAGHAVDPVVDEDHRDGFAAIGGVDDLRRADGRQVAIALIADHDALRPAALHGRGHRGGAPVRHLNVAHVEIVVGEDGAADRADQHRAVLDAQFVDGLGQQFVDDAVAAAGAVVRLMLQFALAFEGVVEGLGPLVDHGVGLAMDQLLAAAAGAAGSPERCVPETPAHPRRRARCRRRG